MATLKNRIGLFVLLDIAREIVEDIDENNEKQLHQDIALMREELRYIEKRLEGTE